MGKSRKGQITKMGLIRAQDESYEYTSEMVKTERTEIIARAIAALMINWNESE